MTALLLCCTGCRQAKPESEFYRRGGKPIARCKDCERARIRDAKEAQRQAVGDEAYRAAEAERQRDRRERTDRAYERACNRATAVLRERHRSEFDRLVARIAVSNGVGRAVAYKRAEQALIGDHRGEYRTLVSEQREVRRVS